MQLGLPVLSANKEDHLQLKPETFYEPAVLVVCNPISLLAPKRGGQKNHPLSCICQGCIFRLTCSHPELTEDHVLTSAYVKIFRTVTRNGVSKSVWRKKNCSWLPLNKHAMNTWLSSLRIRAHLSWRTGKHLHVLHVLRTYSTCSCPG